MSDDPSTCTGYALRVNVETAAGTVLGVGLADVWKLVPIHGEYSCRASYSATVTRQNIYTLHADDAGFADVAVQASQITSGLLPIISGHLS